MVLKDVNLNLVQTFCLIYEHRGIGRAADELHVSQPTVSYSLKQLRKAFNDQLFSRVEGQLQPTPRAMQIYPDLRAALDLIEATGLAAGEFDPRHSTHEFVLMLSDLGEMIFLPQIQRTLEGRAPSVRLRVEPLDVQAAPEKIISGEIDAAIMTPQLYSEDLARRVIYRDFYVVVASLDHPRVQGELSADQLSGERIMRIQSSVGHSAPEDLLQQTGLNLRAGVVGTRMAPVPGVVMNSDLLGIVPYAVVESLGWGDRMQILESPIPIEPMEVSLMSRVERRRAKLQSWLIDLIVETVEILPKKF